MAAQAPEGPRVRVAALIVIDGSLVVVRHRAGSRRYHLLPGGGVDYRETLEAALIREVREETGLEITVGRPLIINDTIDPSGTRHVVNILFETAVTGGSITKRPSDARIEAVELVDPAGLSGMDLRPPLADEVSRVLRDRNGYRTAYVGSLFSAEG